MCAKPGKIISSPKMVRVIHSASTLSVEYRKHYRYMLKLAIRRAVADMKEIMDGGDPKSAAFLRSELKKLPVFEQEKNVTARPAEPKDSGAAPAEASVEADAGMDVEDGLWK